MGKAIPKNSTFYVTRHILGTPYIQAQVNQTGIQSMLRIKNKVTCTEPNRLIPVSTRRLTIVDKFLKDLFFQFFEVNARISHSYMARQLTGTRVSLTLEAKSLQYKPHALTLKNCILPSFLCYRVNEGVLQKRKQKQTRCRFRQRSENISL